MDAINLRNFVPAILAIFFLSLCVYFTKKAEEGPWHSTAVDLWEKEEWHKLRALGENLNRVGKEDVEAFHVAMLASRQMNDATSVRNFASLLSDSRALNWKLEQEIARNYKPDSFRKRLALFRTRLILTASILLLGVLIFSWKRREPYRIAPAAISIAGMLILWL